MSFNLDDENTEYTTEQELDDILANMHYELFIHQVDEQIDNPLTKSKRDFLQLYIDEYKYLENEYEENVDFLKELKEERNETFEHVIRGIEEQFKININRDEDIKISKVTKAAYRFFILDYAENLSSLIVNFIMKNRKVIINELRSMKNKSRDVSYNATKDVYNQNDAIILNNINTIIFTIMPDFYDDDHDTDFISLITSVDDNFVNKTIDMMFSEGMITSEDNLYYLFMKPIFDKQDGYSDVVSDVITDVYSKCVKNNTNINII